MSTNTNGKVAIILPVFNTEQYLETCVRSILDQDYQNFEIYAVNDGSTDQSRSILQKLADFDTRIKIIDQANGGLSNARNTALDEIYKNSNYEYIAFVDSDDVITKRFLSEHISRLEKDGTDVSVCGYARLYDSGKIKSNRKFETKKILSQEDFLKLVFTINEWQSDGAAGGMVWKLVYRTSVIHGIKFINDRAYMDDEPFCIQVAKRASKFSYIAAPLYLYRQRSLPTSLSLQTGFKKRLIAGRRFCAQFSPKISQQANLICTSAYVQAVISYMKQYNDVPCDIAQFGEKIKEAHKQGLINDKYYFLYRIFTKHPFCAKTYKAIRFFYLKLRH